MKRALRLVNLIVAVAVVGIVVARSHPSELAAALRDTDVGLAALAVLLNVPVLLLAPLRSYLVFRKLGYAVPLGVLFPTTVLGFVAGGLTPAASGELLRAGVLRGRAGVPFDQSVVAVVYERGLGTYILGLTTVALLAAANLSSGWAVAAVGGCLLLVLTPWFVAQVVPPGLVNGRESRGVILDVLGRGLAMFSRVRFLLRDLGLLLQVSLVSVAMFAVISLQYWFLAKGVSGGISFVDAWQALGISTLAAVVTLIPLGLGILDSSLAAVLDRLGLTLEQGAAVAVLVRATVTLPLVLAAFACYLYLHQTSPREPATQGRETA